MADGLTETNFDMDSIGLESEFALNSTTASFKNIFPQSGSYVDYQEEYNFSWEPALGATSYTLTIATDEDFEDVVFEKTTVQTGVAVTGLSNETPYYYR